MNDIKVSVIIPVYNTEKYLRKCLDSVIAQTFKDLEIICVDNCSTDTSRDILLEYERKDSRIKNIFLDENKKAGGARNAGLDIAKGEYITFVDSDDYIAEALIEKMYEKAEINYCDLVVTNIENIVIENNEAALELKRKYDTDYKNKALNTGFYVFEFYTSDIRLGPVAKLYKKEIIDQYQIRFPEGLINEDDAFYWCYMPYVTNLYSINETLYFRNIHPNSTMYRLRIGDENIYNQIHIIKYIYKYLKKYNFYKLYKEKFLEYVETVLNSKQNPKVRRKYFIQIGLFMPAIIKLLYNEFALLIQLIMNSKQNPKVRRKYFIQIGLFMPAIIKLLYNEFALLIQLIMNKKDKIAFWGASIFLEQFIKKYHIKFENIVGIVDKDSKKWGNKIEKYEVFSPEKLEELGAETVVFTVKNNAHRIYPKVKEEIDEKYPKIKLLKNIFSEKIKSKPYIPHKHLERFSIHLTEHCNLNCKSCNNFSPLAEKKFADIKSFERDIKRIAELTERRIKRIYLIGGEPLLHPDIIEFMKVSRLYLPKTRIIILTNGILLPNMSEEFWQACEKYNMAIEVTKYPININFDKIEEIASKYNIEYGYFCNTGRIIKTSNQYLLDVNGKQNPKTNFKMCDSANKCMFLKDGRIYTCAIAPNIEHFNKYFGYNIPLLKTDGIDIHKAKSEKEIVKFIAKPINFCRYCNVKNWIFGTQWEVSKKDINEWFHKI